MNGAVVTIGGWAPTGRQRQRYCCAWRGNTLPPLLPAFPTGMLWRVLQPLKRLFSQLLLR